MLEGNLLKSGTKKNQPTNEAINVDLERKRASHIMHYLMERKNEQEY